MWRHVLWIGLLLLAAACQTQTPTAVGSVVGWDGSAQNIVFRVDIEDNEDPFRARGAVPTCTIYGDGRVVWLNQLEANQFEVLYDRLPDATVSQFVEQLTVDERIYTYQAQTPEVGIDPPILVERIFINVNGIPHSADQSSGWSTDWFGRIRRTCSTLSQTPVLFQPSGGWLLVQESTFSSSTPMVIWNREETGVSLAEVADSGQPRWITGSALLEVWDRITNRPSMLVLAEESRYFRVALQIPGITRESPPAPSS